MTTQLDITTYTKENGDKFVLLSHDGSSGVRYPYADRQELIQVIKAYCIDFINDHYEKDGKEKRGTK